MRKYTETMNRDNASIEQLLSTIQKLRGEGGCPWDIKQTPNTLIKYLNEEVEELIQAIENDDLENICEEIGDVFYVLLMLTEIYQNRNMFNLSDCLLSINSKLIRRHPHVFANVTINNDDELRQQWEHIKKEEKKQNI
jgi:uncharacterized protein YabN with tetrapyrrole methylase and pyrophosphatase domain